MSIERTLRAADQLFQMALPKRFWKVVVNEVKPVIPTLQLPLPKPSALLEAFERHGFLYASNQVLAHLCLRHRVFGHSWWQMYGPTAFRKREFGSIADVADMYPACLSIRGSWP